MVTVRFGKDCMVVSVTSIDFKVEKYTFSTAVVFPFGKSNEFVSAEKNNEANKC